MSTLIAEFTVVGTPVPQGSNRAFIRGGKPRIVAGNQGPLERWRGDIRSAVRMTRESFSVPLGGAPVSMRLTFRVGRPVGHYLPANSKRQARELRVVPPAPTWRVGGADLDKLVRAVLDALTGVVYVDDSQVVVIGAEKRWADPGQPGVDVRVTAL